MRWPENNVGMETEESHHFRSIRAREKTVRLTQAGDAYFPCSAVMYSSQEMVLGAGAVSDCLLTGCHTGKEQAEHQAARSPSFRQDALAVSSPQTCARQCCRLCSGSPSWLCSSGCLPHSGARAACETPAPGRSRRRSQPGSSPPSPASHTSRRGFHLELTSTRLNYSLFYMDHFINLVRQIFHSYPPFN